MTRHELAPYENCCILVSSTPVGKKKHDYYLHKDITITTVAKILNKEGQYVRITEPEITQKKVDHLWISPNIVKTGNIVNDFTKLFDKVVDVKQLHFLARVEKYTRNDGTKDYGLTSVTEVEHYVYKILMFGFLYSRFLRYDSLVDYYFFYKKELTTTPLTISNFWNTMVDHLIQLNNEAEPHKNYYNNFLADNFKTPYFTSVFSSDLYSALHLHTAFFEKVIKVGTQLDQIQNDRLEQRQKRAKKKRCQQRIKSRARGFAPNVKSH